MTVQALVAVLLAAQLSLGMAASPVIGVATAKGSFRLDNASVAGNGTLVEGMTIETQRATSDLELSGGGKMTLATQSRGRVYRDRLVLERGEGQVSNPGPFAKDLQIEARSLRVVTAESGSIGRVSVRGGNRVQVAALMGGMRVLSSSGTMIAMVSAGQALEFEPQQAGASAPSRLTGCVVKRDGHYFLTDDTARVTVELKGGNIEKYAGHKVEISGSQIPGGTPAGNATQLIRISDLKDVEKRCTAGAGALAGGAAAGSKSGTAASTAGMTAGTKAVIAGVVVAAVATGTAVGITQTNDDEPPATQSR